MKVTIVTPVYNGMPWLPESIFSVAAQRRDVEIEHLVYDAGSTDGSTEWLREHSSLGFRAIIGPDAGQTDALAKGFDAATGEILGWLNSDDLLEAGALKRIVEVFEADRDVAVVSGVCLVIDSGGAVTGAIPPPPLTTWKGLLCLSAYPPQPATFFSAEAYRSGEGLDRRYDLAMDLDLWLKLAKAGRIRTLPHEVLARFRIQPRAKTAVSAGAAARQALSIRRRHGMPLRSPAGVDLLRAGYIRPVVSPWTRAFRRILRRLIGSSR